MRIYTTIGYIQLKLIDNIARYQCDLRTTVNKAYISNQSLGPTWLTGIQPNIIWSFELPAQQVALVWVLIKMQQFMVSMIVSLSSTLDMRPTTLYHVNGLDAIKTQIRFLDVAERFTVSLRQEIRLIEQILFHAVNHILWSGLRMITCSRYVDVTYLTRISAR